MIMSHLKWLPRRKRTNAGFYSVCALALALLAELASAGEVAARVTTASGVPVANAVIALYAAKKEGMTAPSKAPADAIMDQHNRQFVPHVLVIQRGASVKFPNSDDIRHQVYSFSSPKRFTLPLYHGIPAKPETFDEAGEVVLGCNIHDSMLGYIYVVDTAWFAKSDAAGALQIADVPAGNYRAQLWYPGLAAAAAPIEKTLAIPASGSVQLNFDNAVAETLAQPQPTTTRSWGARRNSN